MKVFRLIVMLAFLLVGLVIGALNSQPILIDFAVTSIPTTSGVAIIVAMLAGALIGGAVVLVAGVLPLYSKLRQANKLSASSGKVVPPAVDATEVPPVDGP